MNSQNLKASVSFVGDGTTNKFYFGFDYINKQFVKVQVGAESSPLTYLTDYTVDDRSVTLTDTPAVGVAIRVYRETTSDRIVEWADGTFIKASQMTLENLQQLHLIEESQDYPILNSLSKYPDGFNFNALGSRIIGVSDPRDPQDVVTKHYMESVQDGFVARNTSLLEQTTTQATNAKNSASSSATSASQSASSASASETSNQSAKRWAESTASPDNQEDMDSTTGKTQSSRSWALYSKEKAQESATSETNAKTSETNAKASETNAKTSETKAATSEANAKTSETNAKSSETKSKDSENAARVSEQNAAESARVATENAMDFNMLKRNKAYSIGDIAYSSYIPSWARLECVKAGTTGAIVPPALGTTQIAGQYITDGTAIFILDDVRDGNRVGDIVLKPTLNDGYIKANGATVKASEYPRLLKFAQDNSLCVSDSEWTDNSATKYVYDASADTLKVPNAMGRVLQGEDTLITKNAGLPNLIGGFNALQTDFAPDGGWVDGRLFSKMWNNFYTMGQGTENHAGGQIVLNASGYNAIYGSSDTVQPPACCLIAQIKY